MIYVFKPHCGFIANLQQKYPMPTAVPATMPPSRLCTKFVPHPACRKTTPKVRNTGRNAHHFCLLLLERKRVSILCPNFGRFSLIFACPNAPKIHPGRPSRALLGHSGCGGTKECHFERFPCEKLIPFRGAFGAPFRPFFFFVPPGH